MESTKVRNTTRTAGVVLAAAAGMMALGAPAFAATPQSGHDKPSISHNHEANGITAGDDNNVQVPVCAAGNNVAAVIAAVVPILSPQTVHDCSTAVLDQS